MSVLQVTPILNVSDVPASLAWFCSLGWTRSFSWNDGGQIAQAGDRNEHGPAAFAGVCSAEASIFLCRDGQGSRGGPVPRHIQGDDTGGVWMSWWVASPQEVDRLYATAQGLGYECPRPPTTEAWGVHECWLRHPDGHTFRVSTSGCAPDHELSSGA